MKDLCKCLFLTVAIGIFNQGLDAQRVLQRCDVTTNWRSSNTLSIDRGDLKEGSGSLAFTGEGTDWFKKVFSQTNVGVDTNGFLSFWLYVSELSAFNGGGQVELGSGGAPDIDEYNWPLSTLGLSNGWNHVKLALNEAGVLGSPSLDAINYFRLYQPLSAPVTAKIDLIRFTSSEIPELATELLDIKEVDKTTLDGKLMFGYQGWFGAIGDGSGLNRFNHWGPLETGSGKPDELAVDMWFDDREFDPDELYETGYKYPDGRNARAFSSFNKKTVFRHMKWLRDYGLDGVFLQRFLTDVQSPPYGEFRDSVAVHVMEGSERYGRAFVMMYDGLGFESSMEKIKADWKHLVDDLKLIESPAYLHHRGRPLVSLWGYVMHEEMDIQHLEDLIEFFHNNPEEKYRATIKIGCDQKWIESEQWKNALKNVEVISPWMVGRYRDKNTYNSFARNYITPAQEWCDNNNVDFMPVSWPGFSWYNLLDGPQNQIPRNAGQFFWDQVSGNLSRGSKSLYVAMFDEVDEGTAMFKLSEDAGQSPDKGYWLDLDDDGNDLPGDWYLRCSNLATETLKGNVNNTAMLQTPADGLDVYTLKAVHTACGGDNGMLILGFPHTGANPVMEFSIDGGESYAHTTPAATESLAITDLPEGTYNVWVRYEDDSYPTDLGDISIFDAIPQISVQPFENSLEITVDDRHYMRPMEISLDSGATYPHQIADSVYRLIIENYVAPDTFQVWYRIKDMGCESMKLYETPGVSIPYMVHSVPGLFQAEHYDLGGEGVAYHETDDRFTGNANFRRDESVDIGILEGAEAGFFMGWNSAGEWVKYTVGHVEGGIYDVEFRIAGPEDGKYYELSINDEAIGKVVTPNTGGYQTWQIVRMKNVVLESGENVVLKMSHSNGVNIDYFRFVDPILPGKASNPKPADGATDVSFSLLMSWTAGENSVSHNVNFGTANPPGFVGNQTFTLHNKWLEPNTTYYWRIDEVSGPLVTEGDVWSFTSKSTTGTGIPESADKAVNIYPNPARSEIKVDLVLIETSEISISLLDITGRSVGRPINKSIMNPGRGVLTLPLSGIDAGTYLVKIEIDNAIHTKFVVVQ